MKFTRLHLLVIALLFVGSIGLSYWIGYPDIMKTASAWGNIATGAGMILVAFSLLVALDANRRSRQASEFSVITEIHKRLNSEDSKIKRGYLHTPDFRDNYKRAFTTAFPQGRPACSADEAAKEQFKKALCLSSGSISPLEAIETTLLDYDLLAVPYYMDIESAIHAAIQWRSVLRDTAPQLIDFIDIMQRVRNDPGYKRHYLYMLHSLRIDIGTLAPPTIRPKTTHILDGIEKT